MKRVLATIFCLILVFSLQGCALGNILGEIQHRELKNSPLVQPGTTWRSGDGKITFTVVELTTINNNVALYGCGTLQLENECIDILFSKGPSKTIWITDYAENIYEWGLGDFWYSDQLTVVFSQTTYLTEGESITFYRMDE